MTVTKQLVAYQLAAHLRQELSTAELVDWAEEILLSDEIELEESPDLRNVIARLGVADVREFGLTWEDCHTLLKKIGFDARVEIVSA
jgi:hypothetical protein